MTWMIFSLLSLANPPQLPCYKGDAKICEVENWIYKYCNGARSRAGVPLTYYSNKLAFASREWSKVRDPRYSGHVGFPHQRSRTIRQEFGEVGLRIIAENAWHGPGSDQATAKSIAYRIYSSWMNSRGHRKSILKANRRYMGVGVAYRDGTYYATQLFGR